MEADKQSKQFYEFGPFRLETTDRLLLKNGEVIPLAPKAIDTLLVLVKHANHVLTKEELMKAVWPDTFVEEIGLPRNISVLRKALGDGPEDTRYIETIPRRGYRFVAEVHEGGTASAAQPLPVVPNLSRRTMVFGSLAAGAAITGSYGALQLRKKLYGGSRIRSLAVLPLENLSQDPARDYFATGMTEALLTSLSKVSALKVVSYPSRNYKQIGKTMAHLARDLNVDAVLNGSILSTESRVRVSARLLLAGTGEVIWAEDYERDLRDIMVLLNEVPRSIASGINLTLTAADQKRLSASRVLNNEAFQSYLQGRYFWNTRTTDGFRKAAGYFQEAISKDSTYAQPYAGLADVFVLLGSLPADALPPGEARARALAAASAALKMDEMLAEAHTSLGNVKLSFEWDWRGAEREFLKAIDLNPGYSTAHHWYAHALIAAGRFQEAISQMKLAQELEPLSLIINTGVGWCYYQARKPDEAIKQFRKVLEMKPDFYLAHLALGLAYGQKGSYQEAIAELQQTLQLSGGHILTAKASLGRFYALADRKQEAERELLELKKMMQARYVPALYPAVIHDALGQHAEAYGWVKKAFDERCEYLVYAKVEPMLDGMRADPRFLDLMRKHKLDL